MPASVIQNNKARDARLFYLSWVPTETGADKTGPRKCAEALKTQLGPMGTDQLGSRVKVIDSAPGARTAGTPLTIGGDAELTDFVALLTAEYAMLNQAAPKDGGTGEFAFVLKEVVQAGGFGGPLMIWTAAIDASSTAQRANWTIAGQRFGDIDCCHALTPDNTLRTGDKTLAKDVSRAVDHLMGFSTCPQCARAFRAGD
jgi:hypothetical protein